ncbi:putative ubiquitin regulatory protein [Dioscorea alata]|uniref:Ubiquitin regulatory protein n=1 Tax=Dioscorea alata TaxID=55571 RepID=A0ACB7W680_DIOAL|nr:putative ubiquitin regulatory protein [Dioscorea alata]
MAVPEVNKEMLRELESMGFPTAHAIRGLHFSGNASIEAAIDWIAEHENDPDIDQMPLVPINIEIESGKPTFAMEYVKIKAQELRQKLKVEEEKRMGTEREKERRRAGKEQLQAKRILEENERKRASAWRKAEQEEVKQARERILKRLEDDKAERRRNLGLPSEDHSSKKMTKHFQNTKISDEHDSSAISSATTVDNLQECLRSLKQNHLDEDARVKRAFQTLLTYIANVAKNPENEKFRKIRLSNPAFMDRVGSMFGGIEFLVLCGFEKLKLNGIEYLYMPRDKVDHRILRNAALELNSALNNPYFGMFSRKNDDY